ncbi:translational GTPase TypA [Candidatus Roizmanbacteria bacterium]|nr:translational GTPase TypA [Candidatus Roizmanbacteria bacterium]
MEKLNSQKIRNIAVIAHVDHGKTTLVDFMLKQSHTFRANEAEMQQTTILDSNPLERERGITILAKNTAINYRDYKINIIDTPGHADFSGEVERTLNMADGALLIIDALEGPMPQTKFVLKKALEMSLKIIVVINKIDKKMADINSALEKTNDLFLDLATNTDQLNFPVFYAIGREGKAALKLEDVSKSTSLDSIMQEIINYVPPPKTEEGVFKMLVTSLSYDSHKGKHIIGKIKQGTLEKGQSVVLVKSEKDKSSSKIENIYINRGLKKDEIEKVQAGEIVELTGVGNASIGDTITDPTDPIPLPRIKVEDPTIKIGIFANTSPFAGKEGKFSNSRQVYERLLKELETNISLRLEVRDDKFMVSGRGELHLSILIETMRREGYEFQVERPEVITKVTNGVEMEPVEDLIIDVPDEFQGIVTRELGERKGRMTNMFTDGRGNTRFEYKIPSKALLGLRQVLLTNTKGTAVINTMFDKYEPLTPPLPKLRNGVLIASEAGTALTFGLENAQGRGITFIDPGTPVYEGMIIGLNSRIDDIEINVAKGKKLTNMRSSTSDIAIALTPPLKMSLEQYLDFLEEDELLEVTPKNLRLRKKLLSKLDRVRARRV